MKLYIIYFRTMDNSPEVTIECATTDKALADAKFAEAKDQEKEYMDDAADGPEIESHYWAEACMESFDMSENRNPGDTIYVFVETEWLECVETTIHPFLYKVNAESQLKFRKQDYLEDYPNLEPLDAETVKDAMSLEDSSIMINVYFSIEEVVVE